MFWNSKEGPSVKELKRFAHVAQEAGEVVMAAGKVIQFGPHKRFPELSSSDNITQLAHEIGDLLAVATRAGVDMDLVRKVAEGKQKYLEGLDQ